ncbi:hypothetical protein C6501_03600 [Candidatus Poribacteria bacterium]|nr:MAG: hypothetical protein C6501_03600 [Candidatus Poribacteria bacterium]
MLFIFSILYLLITFAQDISQFSLPEGAKARFGKGYVNQIQYSPDGTRLAVASSIGIWLYDTTTYKEIALLTGHTGNVPCIAFNPDGSLLASGSWDKTVRLWDMKTGKHKQTLTGHLHAIVSVVFSPDGKTLVSGSTGKRDGDKIFGAQILMWNTDTGKHSRTLTAQGHVNSLAFSPDGKTFASGEGWPEYVVQLWDANTGKKRHKFTAHTDWVNCIAFPPNKNILVSASIDGTIHIWNANTGKHNQTLTEHTRGINTIAFSPDGSLIATGDWFNIVLWDATTGISTHTLDTEHVKSVTFSPDGKTFASAHHGRNPLIVWDVATWTQKHAIIGYTHPVLDITLSSDNNTLASGGFDPDIYLWDVVTGKPINKLQAETNYIHSVAFSPDGQTLASGSSRATVFLWDVITNTKKHTFSAKHEDLIQLRSVAFSPDLNILAGGSFETVHLWNVVKGELIRTLQGHTGDVHSVAFSPDGKLLATGSDVEHIGEDHSFGYKGVRLWDVESGEQKEILKGKMGDIYSVAFSPDGKTLASGEGWADYAIRLWDISTGEQKQILKGHTGIVHSVVFSPDGMRLASGSGDNTIRLWDVATGKHIRTFKGHTWYVNSVIFNANGSMLASGSYDGTVLLWDIAVSDDKK